VELSAVADPDGISRRNVTGKRDIAAFDDAEAMLQGAKLDAVIIALPTHMHAAAAAGIARAGKAFYLEKPIAITESEAALVRNAAAEAGVKAVVGFNRRAHPLYQRARQLLRDGAIGEVHGAQTVFSEPAPPDGLPTWKKKRETGGGALLDLGSHHVDLLRWLLDTEIETVSASVRTIATEGDFASINMKLANGAHAQSTFTLASAYADHLEILGTTGTLRIERHSASLTLSGPRRFGYGRRERSVGTGISDIVWRARRLARPAEDPSYLRAMRSFVRHLRNEEPVLASLDDGERSLRVILAAEESSRRASSPVTVAPPA
jgi:myo-inositol 2-dehydrogenase/D-chiro-inositol 1-dehydrogenase